MNSQQQLQSRTYDKQTKISKKIFIVWLISLLAQLALLVTLPIVLTRTYFRFQPSQLQFANCQTYNLQSSTLRRLNNNNSIEIVFIICLSISAVNMIVLSIFLLKVVCKMQQRLRVKQRLFFLGMSLGTQWLVLVAFALLFRQIVDFSNAQWCITDNQFIIYRDNLYLPISLVSFALLMLLLMPIFYLTTVERCKDREESLTFSTSQQYQQNMNQIPEQLSLNKQTKFLVRQLEHQKTGSGRKKQNGIESSSNSKLNQWTSASKIFMQRFPSGRKSRKNIFEHFSTPIPPSFQQSNMQLNEINKNP